MSQRPHPRFLSFGFAFCLWVGSLINFASAGENPRSAQWKNAVAGEGDYFPIGVWLQDPRNAARFKAAGINLYVGLYRGPTAEQLALLQAAGMPVICSQNRAGLQNRDNPLIVAWMHGDEPDNAQSLRDGSKGYGPPITPDKIVQDYERIRAADPARPIMLNLGQGVAWDNYIGRGVRRNHPEDYPEYLKGCDIASFDIYPVVHDHADIKGKLEYVPKGVDRLIKWTHGEKVVWNCIECTHIGNPDAKATPGQVRSEVWMAIIHGSRGLIYFVHQFKPAFREAALLDDPEMLAGITALNRQIRELAPVLNSASLPGNVSVATSVENGEVATMLKQRNADRYLFAANMQNRPMRVTFSVADLKGKLRAEVLGEGRDTSVDAGSFAEDFGAYAVHLYRIVGN